MSRYVSDSQVLPSISMLKEPRCFTRRCRHFIGVDQPDGTELTERVICAAFPSGIPAEIAYGDNLHLRAFSGDHGILYEKGTFDVDEQPQTALQFTKPEVALRVDEKICLHFVRVLDQTALRTDDTYEAKTRTAIAGTTDRAYWQSKVGPEMLAKCDTVVKWLDTLVDKPHHLRYRKEIVDIVCGSEESPVWLRPKKTLLQVGAYVSDPASWVKRFDDLDVLAALKRGNKAVAVSLTPQSFDTHVAKLQEFLTAAVNVDIPPLE